jgi:hypothetical protein
MVGFENVIDQRRERRAVPIRPVFRRALRGLIDFGEQGCRLQAETPARFGDRNLPAAAEVDALLFKDPYRRGKFGGNLPDGAVRSECGS